MHIKMETLFCVGTLDYKTFKGSYGIHVVRMDGEKGSLTHVSERNDGYNPSFLISNKTGTGNCVTCACSLPVCGNEVTITVEGEDEEAAAAKIEEFMKSNM